VQTPSVKQRVLGDFVIESEIGRGGMGVVWLATQRSLGRKVALKALPSFATMDAAAVLRFRREAEATGRIAHPGIVPVYGTGEVDGIHWFAMEYIDGPTLGSLLERLAMRQVEKLRASLVDEAEVSDLYPSMREMPGPGGGNEYVRSCARLCADVANALVAAHRAQVIHRDLKPNNILIHPAGRPVLVDFGLARDERQQSLTRSGDQIGTPAYMAPEQARGHRDVDARTDVYGLGAVLYELLTLHPPFEAATSAEIAHRILTEEPVAVRRHNPNVPVDLAAIVHRCLAKAPDDRYPAMEALELDLRCFLAGRPVVAALPGRIAQLQGVLQRKWRSLTIGATAAAAATLVAVLAGLADDRSGRENGRELLRQATALLVDQCDVERARALYDQASALTKDPDGVAIVRLRDFRAAFQRHYADKPRGPRALAAFAAAFSAGDHAKVQDLLDRLDGRGTLRLPTRTLELQVAKVEVRALQPSGLTSEWRTVRPGTAQGGGEPLAVGEYLLRVTDRAGAVATSSVRIDADAEVAVEPRFLPADAQPPGMAVVCDPADQQVIAVGRCEVTRNEWRRWLQTLTDPLVIAEMTPSVWESSTERDELPVRGLSFLQARAFVRAAGAHLPTAREHWLAGSAGLRGLAYPWGNGVDRARLAADPFHMDETMPVRSLVDGQSPLGVLHVLGNVAEIHSAAADGRLRMGGGSFLDDPTGLRLLGDAGEVPTAPLPGLQQGHPGAGLRLYRFLTPPADDKAKAAMAQQQSKHRDDLRAANEVCLFSDWEVRSDGIVTCAIEWNGRYHDGDQRSLLLPFDTPGFLQRKDTIKVLDGHGNELHARVETKCGERSQLDTTLAEYRNGQGYRFTIAAELDPADGLLPALDGYVLRLPMKRGYRIAQVYTLTLPPGSHVDEALPEPKVSADRRTLTWEQEAGQIETAVVHFRCDGAIGAPLLQRKAIEERTDRFLRLWNRQADALVDQLDVDFQFRPGGIDRATLKSNQPQVWLKGQKDQQVVDAVRIGATETVQLRVDWEMRDRAQNLFVLHNWPYLLQTVWRDEKTPMVVRLQPVTAVDGGRYDGHGGYVHEGMHVRIDAVPGAELCRTQEELVDLQVKLLHSSGFLVAQVLGCIADVTDAEGSIRLRLSGGASILRPGRRIDGGAPDAATQEWQFEAGDQCVRERWLFLQSGRRHLLVRQSAAGQDDVAARRAFEAPAAVQWFEAVRAALHVD